MSEAAGRVVRRDLIVGLGLGLAVVVYLGTMPHNLGVADEAFFLNDSKRIYNGQRIYRDVFYYATPGAHWVMAAVYALFGTTMRVARLSMAVLHGLIVATVYWSCRRLAVDRSLAAAAAVATLALCQPAWPYASLHWYSTLLSVVLLFVLVGPGWTKRPIGAAVPGVVVGALIAVQQQKGVVTAAATAVLIALLAAVERRRRIPAALAIATRRMAWFAAGVAAVVVPLFIVLIALVGIPPLIEQLVVFPFTGYRQYNHADWGQVLLFTGPLARYTVPTILKYLPAVLVLTALRAAWLWIAHPSSPRLVPLLAILAGCGGATLSILYLPDFIHIAFVAPLYLIAWAEAVQTVVHTALATPPRRRWAAQALAGACGAATIVLLGSNAVRARREFPIRHDTAFGEVDFATQSEADLVDRVRALLAAAGTREFFAYPMYTSLYLTTDSDNPTPFHMMLPEWNTPTQYETVVRVLDAHRLPYVFTCPVPSNAADPILTYVAQHYERLDPQPCSLMRRRDFTPPADAPP
jgi:hypothetical protein